MGPSHCWRPYGDLYLLISNLLVNKDYLNCIIIKSLSPLKIVFYNVWACTTKFFYGSLLNLKHIIWISLTGCLTNAIHLFKNPWSVVFCWIFSSLAIIKLSIETGMCMRTNLTKEQDTTIRAPMDHHQHENPAPTGMHQLSHIWFPGDI